MALLHTPLDALHRELGARMVPFAGYDMPVQYASGIIREHEHTRTRAGLFDVSHMGQLVLEGEGAADLLESLVPADVHGLAVGAQTYAVFTNAQGGALDDLIITRWDNNRFFLVVNAACKAADLAHLRAHLGGQSLTELTGQGLLALQGPAARQVMQQLCPDAAQLVFMRGMFTTLGGAEVYVSCSGYTGEDGFEISVAAAQTDAVARALLAQEEVAPVGLGARDSLRLEAGLCLYGHELAPHIDLATAGLMWSVGKARRADGSRPGGFPGADLLFALAAAGTPVCRVGLKVDGRRPVREGQGVYAGGEKVGEVCSACFSPSLDTPIAMAYLQREFAAGGTALQVDVRGKLLPVSVASLPFVRQRYYRG